MLARLQPFASNPAMVRLLSRPGKVNFGRLMDEGRIVLFKLSKCVLQDVECQLLGTIMLKAFHTAALARAARPATERRPFHLVVDEFHTFATDAALGLFREARKYGLGLTVATQTWSSLRSSSERSELPNAMLASTALGCIEKIMVHGMLEARPGVPSALASPIATTCRNCSCTLPSQCPQAKLEDETSPAMEMKHRSRSARTYHGRKIEGASGRGDPSAAGQLGF